LYRAGIDFTKKENLVWAPNVAGQHTLENLKKVLEELRRLEAANATKDEFLEAFKRLGGEASRR
jgi:hypothetical protein